MAGLKLNQDMMSKVKLSRKTTNRVQFVIAIVITLIMIKLLSTAPQY
jgi:hypothetical protein